MHRRKKRRTKKEEQRRVRRSRVAVELLKVVSAAEVEEAKHRRWRSQLICKKDQGSRVFMIDEGANDI